MKTAYLNFAVGLLYGFGLGVLLDQASLVNLTSVSLLLLFLFLVPAIGWIETLNHRRRVKNWQRIEKQGKFVFIVSRYVLFRGGIFAAIMMWALRSNPPSRPVHEIGIPLLVAAMAFIGYQEWDNCTREFATHGEHSRDDDD